MTNRELVSRVMHGFNAVNKDARIPRRYILKVATDKALFYMAQKFRDRSLFRETNLYKTIDCIEMIKIDKVQCDIVEFRTCNTVMRSKEKLPKLVYTRYGSSLKEVTNIDYSIAFTPTYPAKYRNDKKRETFRVDNYFYVRDGYLYLPESEVKRVSVYLYTPEGYEADKSSCDSEKKCVNPWDSEFVVSDKILELIVQEVRQEISMRFNIPEDENPNMDSNIKTKTTA